MQVLCARRSRRGCVGAGGGVRTRPPPFHLSTMPIATSRRPPATPLRALRATPLLPACSHSLSRPRAHRGKPVLFVPPVNPGRRTVGTALNSFRTLQIEVGQPYAAALRVLHRCLGSLAVDDAARGKGYARQLTDIAAARARAAARGDCGSGRQRGPPPNAAAGPHVVGAALRTPPCRLTAARSLPRGRPPLRAPHPRLRGAARAPPTPRPWWPASLRSSSQWPFRDSRRCRHPL